MKELFKVLFQSSDTIFATVVMFAIFSYLFYMVFRLFTAFINIQKKGYPPEHCNANGEIFEDGYESVEEEEDPDE